ncbi:MAG: hypothetical protein GC134_07445 [Proteobacteria bacterium]|nr:hypothetical protein [Pseudomonadota bacterium]
MPGLLIRLLPLWGLLFFSAFNVLLFNLPRDLFLNPLMTYGLPVLAGVAAGLLFGHSVNAHVLGKPSADARPAPWGLVVMLYGAMPALMFSIFVPMAHDTGVAPDLLGLFGPMIPFALAFGGVGMGFSRYLERRYGQPYWAARKQAALGALNKLLLDMPYPSQRYAVILQQADKLDATGIERLIAALELIKRQAPAIVGA